MILSSQNFQLNVFGPDGRFMCIWMSRVRLFYI